MFIIENLYRYKLLPRKQNREKWEKNLLVVHVVYYMIQAVDNYKWTGYLHPYSKYYVIKVHAYMLANGCVFKRYIHNIFFSNLAM